jgi:hypothetical protein
MQTSERRLIWNNVCNNKIRSVRSVPSVRWRQVCAYLKAQLKEKTHLCSIKRKEINTRSRIHPFSNTSSWYWIDSKAMQRFHPSHYTGLHLQSFQGRECGRHDSHPRNKKSIRPNGLYNEHVKAWNYTSKMETFCRQNLHKWKGDMNDKSPHKAVNQKASGDHWEHRT